MIPSEVLRLQRQLAGRNAPILINKSKVPFPDGFHAYIGITNETIKAGNYHGLLQVWTAYQKQKKLNLSDPSKYLDEAICVALQRERGNSSGFCAQPHRQSPDNHQIDLYRNDSRGPKDLRAGQRGRDAMAWKALHLAALDNRLTQSYLDTFTSRIGCGSCKGHWKTLLRNNPPKLTPDSGAFEWTIIAHNLVSAKLSPPKPEISVDEARRIWSS